MYKKYPHCECFKRVQAYLFGFNLCGINTNICWMFCLLQNCAGAGAVANTYARRTNVGSEHNIFDKAKMSLHEIETHKAASNHAFLVVYFWKAHHTIIATEPRDEIKSEDTDHSR
jgi:hypothetical protein